MKVNKLHHSVSTSKLFSFDIFGHLTFKKVCVLAQKALSIQPTFTARNSKRGHIEK